MSSNHNIIPNIPRLPLELIVLVAEQLSDMGHFGTLAKLNLTCKRVRQETKRALWKRVVVKRIGSVATTSYSPDGYLALFKRRYGGEEYYKYIKYIIDTDCLLKSSPVQPQVLNPTQLANPFRTATNVGACLTPLQGCLNSSTTSCSVRLGARYEPFTDALVDTLQAQLKAPPPTLFDTIEFRSSVKLHLAIPEHVKTAHIEPLATRQVKHVFESSPLGWFPSGRINHVEIKPEYTGTDASTFDKGHLQTLTLDTLNLLAVSAGKHVLLGCDKKCARPVLSINGLTLEEVDVVIGIWFTVIEHMPIYAGIKLVLALREGTPIDLGIVAIHLRTHKPSCLRHKQAQGDCPGLQFKLVDASQRLIAILGKPLHQYRNKAAGMCLYDPNERRMRMKCAVFEKWVEQKESDTSDSSDVEMDEKATE